MGNVPRRPNPSGSPDGFWEAVGTWAEEWAVAFIVPDVEQDLLKSVHITAKLALESNLPFVRQAYYEAREFWQLADAEISAGDDLSLSRARRMLNFPEPKSIRFGYAKGSHNGHGIGKRRLNRIIFTELEANPVYRRMLAEEPDSTCLIDQIAVDRSSDILATIIMGVLCEFTVWCAEFYGFSDSCMKDVDMRVWSRSGRRFIYKTYRLPHDRNGAPIVLVPKIMGRSAPPMNPGQYFRPAGPSDPSASNNQEPATKARLLKEFREHPEDAVKFVRDRMKDSKNFLPRKEYRPPKPKTARRRK